MDREYINLTPENLADEHLCCAIADKKHQAGVTAKKSWLKDRLSEGHVFRKLNAQGKVFIEYAPLEKAWVPVSGENYVYIYCLWVSGSFKGKGHGKDLLEYCIADAKKQGKSGVCILSSNKKKSFLSDKKFLTSFGFETVDSTGDEILLMALSFDGTQPRLMENAKTQQIADPTLTVFYSVQCPYIPNCIEQIERYCASRQIPLHLFRIDTLEKAKTVPGVLNNWAVFMDGKFQGVQLLNEGFLQKMLAGKIQ